METNMKRGEGDHCAVIHHNHHCRRHLNSPLSLQHTQTGCRSRPLPSTKTTTTTILICLVTITVALIAHQPKSVGAIWFSSSQETQNQSLSDLEPALQVKQAALKQQQISAATETGTAQAQVIQQEVSSASSGYNYGAYGASLMSIAGIQPSSIASLLNTVGDTGFRYFNIQDQCRNRAACDLGSMLYKKISFVHNWLIRTSVRTLTDMNNVYTQSWMEGMLGRNCTAVYVNCRQSPLEGLMNLALLQHLAS